MLIYNSYNNSSNLDKSKIYYIKQSLKTSVTKHINKYDPKEVCLHRIYIVLLYRQQAF